MGTAWALVGKVCMLCVRVFSVNEKEEGWGGEVW